MLNPSRLIAILAAFAIFAASLAQYSGALKPPPDLRVGFESITEDDCRLWLNTLASREFGGRGTGQPGFQKAAQFVADRFKEFGLKPVGDNGTYFHAVPFSRTRISAESKITGPGELTLMQGADVGFQVSESSEIEAKLLFVRAGSDGERLLDTSQFQGAIAVIATPKPANLLRNQILAARPAAVLTVADTLPPNEWVLNSPTGSRVQSRRVSGVITTAAARRLAYAVGLDASVADAAFAGSTTEVFSADTPVKLEARVEKESINVPNVVGLIEGSDPLLKHEVVGIGAHLDHLGERDGAIYYGADDNASGTTALLAIARAFSLNPIRPKRSILFLAFSAEEMGLIGSYYYVNNPIIPNDKMICLLQMDMVGRNEESRSERAEDNIDTIHLVGSKRIATELHDLIIEANAFVQFKFEYDEEDVYTRSDHYAFAQKGIPVAFLFSGFHPDYHQPSDTPDKINFSKIVSAAKLFYLTANMAANRERPFKRNAGGEK